MSDKVEVSPEVQSLMDQAAALRGYYDADNRVGLLLDELITDLRAGAARAEILQDAADIQAEYPGTTVSKAIGRILPRLQQLAD